MFLLLITSRIAIRLFSFNKILLFIKKLAFDGLKYPLLVVLKKNRFLLLFKICSIQKFWNRFCGCSDMKRKVEEAKIDENLNGV